MPTSSAAFASPSGTSWIASPGQAEHDADLCRQPRSYVLSTDDADRWRQVLPASVNVYAGVEHMRLCARESGCAARLFVVEAPEPVLAYPFFVRPIDNLPFAADFQGYSDSFTPTYTGPIALGTSPVTVDLAGMFGQYCRQERIVSEFAHLNPWSDCASHLDPACLELNREVVCVDLTLDADRIWRDSLSSDCRRMTKQAQTAGVRVRRAESCDDVAEFHRLHTLTMDRRHAHDRYYFNTDHFQTIFQTMPDNAFFVLAEYEGRVVAGGMFLQDKDTIYWDLSAADMEFQRVRPVNAYVHDTISRSLGQGRKQMLLGGAYQAGDGIFRFKAGFSPLRAKFSIYKKVHDDGVYSGLTEAWSRHHGGAAPADGFFPAYRSNPPTSES